jgi:hypothetical protein
MSGIRSSLFNKKKVIIIVTILVPGELGLTRSGAGGRRVGVRPADRRPIVDAGF